MAIPSILAGFCASQPVIYPRVETCDQSRDLIEKFIFDNLTFSANLAFHTVTIAKIVETIDSSRFPKPRKLYITASVISCIYGAILALKYTNPTQNNALVNTLPGLFRGLNHDGLPIALLTLALYGSYHNHNRKPLILMIGAMSIVPKLTSKVVLDANVQYNNMPYFFSLLVWAGSAYFNGLKR